MLCHLSSLPLHDYTRTRACRQVHPRPAPFAMEHRFTWFLYLPGQILVSGPHPSSSQWIITASRASKVL